MRQNSSLDKDLNHFSLRIAENDISNELNGLTKDSLMMASSYTGNLEHSTFDRIKTSTYNLMRKFIPQEYLTKASEKVWQKGLLKPVFVQGNY